MTRPKLLWIALLCALIELSVMGCSQDYAMIDQESRGAMLELSEAFPRGHFGPDSKADGFWEKIEPCKVLKNMHAGGDQYIRPGYYMAIEGNGVLGPTMGISGYDVVFDLYHHQMSVSAYQGRGLTTSFGAGASITYAEGVALGFKNAVSDWNGYFVNSSLSAGIPLPWISDLANVNVAYFQSGKDHNRDGMIGHNEVVMPPRGIYGASASVSFGANILPTLPVNINLSKGLWQPHKSGIRSYYQRIKNSRLWKAHIPVRLVDAHTGETCSEDWPHIEGHRDCFIEFGHPHTSHTRAALYQAITICYLSGTCLSPLSGPAALGAIAIGSLRDAGGDLHGLCPDMAVR